MINLDISQAVFLYLIFSVIAVLFIWVFFDQKSRITRLDEEKFHIWQCNVCMHTYVDSLNRDVSRCPLCNSLNEKKGEGNGDKPSEG